MALFSKQSSSNTSFKIFPMKPKHLDAVLAIIDAHDEDDAEAAATEYERLGLDNQYVLCDGDTVVGMTGFREAPNTQGSAWLSWTYLDDSIQGQSHGKNFVNEIIEQCKNKNYCKLFVSTSDYIDDEDGDIYAKARQFYQSIGFVKELTLPDYFDEGESKLIYSLVLNTPQGVDDLGFASSAFVCTDTFELLESDDTYTIAFDMEAGIMSSGQKDIEAMIERAKSEGAKRLYVGLPSTATVIQRVLIQCGFQNVGKIKDYYQPGVSEVNFKLDC